ncbi:MAG: hypothetical protein J5742_02630 [Alphaproteobacteria bacterium]|nr:hypothetical protein [Alphaproteobacteria bacterium]
MKKILLTSILAVIVGTTVANADNNTGDKKVTSKSYVDTKFQEKIPVNSATITSKAGTVNIPNTLVLSPNDTPGEVGERGVLDYDLINIPAVAATITGNYNTPPEDVIDLLSLDAFEGLVPTAEIIAVAAANSLDEKQNKMTCVGWLDGTITPDATHTNANCALWNFEAQ